MSRKVNNIIKVYQKLSAADKTLLFLKLQQLDMREHYDPTIKKYKVQMTNIFGQYLVDRTFTAYNRRNLNRELQAFCQLKHLRDYDPIWAEAGYTDEKKRQHYKMTTLDKVIITEL